MFDREALMPVLLFILCATVFGCLSVVSYVSFRAMTAKRRQYLFKLKDLCQDDYPAQALHGSEQRLAKGLQIPTVSTSPDDPPPRKELLQYHRHLRDSFPTVFGSSVVRVEAINKLSLLFTVTGTDASLSPYLLLSHMDVVPVNEENWKWPPFAGIVEGGNIIGRGAIDVKNTGHAILESLEQRLKVGDLPRRSMLVAFGHDEEVHGVNGAGKIAEVLTARQVKPVFCLDEGLMILEDFTPGLKRPLAVIGVCEKGFLSLELATTGVAGHSSIPPLDMAVGRLAHAISKLHPNPQPVLFDSGPLKDLFETIGPVASPIMRIVYANTWLFGSLIKRTYMKNKAQRASIMTTTAVTILQAGYKENIVPGEARAVINHRVHPLMNKDDVIAIDRAAISDPEVKIKVRRYDPPSPISPYGEKDAPFNMLAGTVQQLYGEDVQTAPNLMVANTDTRYYLELTPHVFRFNPITIRPGEVSRFHGDDEMISIKDYHNCIRFYYRLMKNMDTNIAAYHMP